MSNQEQRAALETKFEDLRAEMLQVAGELKALEPDPQRNRYDTVERLLTSQTFVPDASRGGR